MKANRSTHSQHKRGPITTYEALVGLRAKHEEALVGATKADRNNLNGAIASIDRTLKSLKAKRAKRKPLATPLREIDTLTDRERVMASLARKIGRGSEAIYHGTRRLPDVLRRGKLVPPLSGETGIFFSRSPETAAYFASLLQTKVSRYSPGVLVLNRRSLIQNYRLEPSRYDPESNQDEREEVIWNRVVNVRRHLMGVVSDADVTKILGSPKHKYLPPKFLSWSQSRRAAFNRKAVEAGSRLIRKGRARVREIIIRERKQLSMECAIADSAACCASGHSDQAAEEVGAATKVKVNLDDPLKGQSARGAKRLVTSPEFST
jgi:hypothetical protein